jgi:hypothetical protein
VLAFLLLLINYHSGIVYGDVSNHGLTFSQDTFNNLQVRHEELRVRYNDCRYSFAKGTFRLVQDIKSRDVIIEGQTKTLGSQDGKIAGLLQEKQTNEIEITTLKEDAETQKTASEQERQEFEKERQEFEKEKKHLKEALATRQDLLHNEQEMNHVLTAEMAEQKKTILRLQQENTAYTTTARKMEKEKARLIIDKLALNGTMTEQSAVIVARESTIEDLTVAVECANETITSLQKKSKNAENERDVALQEAAIAKEEAGQAKLQASKDNQEATEAREETAEVKLAALKAKREAIACTKLYHELGEDHDTPMREKESLRDEYEQIVSGMTDLHWKLTEILHNVEVRVNDLQTENDNAQISLTHKNGQLMGAGAEISALTMKLNNQSDLLLEKSDFMLKLERELLDLNEKYKLMNINGEKLFGEVIEQEILVLALQEKNTELQSKLESAQMQVTHPRRKHRGGKQHKREPLVIFIQT